MPSSSFPWMSRFPWILRFTRVMVIFFLVGSCALACTLIGQTADVAADPEVRLTLDTTRPAHFQFWYGMQAGFDEGASNRPRRTGWDALPALYLPAGQEFELAANPTEPILRYQEPSAWKRVALLALGALPGNLSVPGLLCWIYGSWLLLKLLQDVTPDTPFTQANAQRLVKLALLVLSLNLWDQVAQFSLLYLVPAFRMVGVAGLLKQYVLLNTSELVPGIGVGFMLIVIAVVYRRGVELSQEAELVI